MSAQGELNGGTAVPPRTDDEGNLPNGPGFVAVI